jgi:succinate dehydrogenase / fumarate reductase iron-sulfur subunit
MKVMFSIQRYNPASDSGPYFQSYELEMEPTDRILDGLISIQRDIDGSLVFRRSCAHGVCGSDAMRINGKDRLACKTLIKEVTAEGSEVKIEPLRHLPVERDLMVNQEKFFANYRSVKPFFISGTDAPADGREIPQSREERERFDDPTKCILCGACFSACPVLDKNPVFLGPAAIVQAARFVNDSRDAGLAARLEILDDENGVWPCENHFECTKACPREIKVTKLINQTKRQIKKARGE